MTAARAAAGTEIASTCRIVEDARKADRTTSAILGRWPVLRLSILPLLPLLSIAGGCGRAKSKPPPAPLVTVSRPVQRIVTDWDEYPGRLAAVDMVDLRARVSGFLVEAPFTEGAIVRKGDGLFVLDAAPYQADLDKAQANLAQAEAQQRYASAEYARLQPLEKTGAVAENQFLNARQAFESGNAAVAAAKAALETAKLNVQWCRVVAPINGRAGRKLVTPGNLITGGTAAGTLLTTIASLDPIYCYADVDERNVLRYQRLVREQLRPSARAGTLPAQLAIGNQDGFEFMGHIDFVNNQIDPSTGTISIRGVFPNPDHRLLPGFYARLRILGRGPHKALLVPAGAVGSTLAQQYVLVVNAENVVQYRPVTLGPRFDDLREVDGVGPDERVVVEGLMNAKPGTKVRVRQVAPAATRPSAQPTSPRGRGPSRSDDGPPNRGTGSPGSGETTGGGDAGAARGTGGSGGGPS